MNEKRPRSTPLEKYELLSHEAREKAKSDLTEYLEYTEEKNRSKIDRLYEEFKKSKDNFNLFLSF
ncbi:hypothetical protein [Christiangramia crocea]|uniref:Uncharacterized protein n=1 Tax=Christiangramia crocea TaxID=2904124 RepID=A0A9X1UVV3_9FLAO|nr:hypothetical protein [Gramella crocea]MCG9971036.1 hypothetical protein [Gramella crocea]